MKRCYQRHQEHILARVLGNLVSHPLRLSAIGQVTKVKSADCILGDSVTCGEAVRSWQDAHLVTLTARQFENHVVSGLLRADSSFQTSNLEGPIKLGFSTQS
jgi:hypothetical protein